MLSIQQLAATHQPDVPSLLQDTYDHRKAKRPSCAPSDEIFSDSSFDSSPVRYPFAEPQPKVERRVSLKAKLLCGPPTKPLTVDTMSPPSPATQKDKSTSEKLVIVMVGLPARGKSYVTKKICRYMNWLQHDTRIFNVGNRRRKVVGLSRSSSAQGSTAPSGTFDHSAGFFDPENVQAGKFREQVAMETLDELLHYLLEENGKAAIFDATNSTIQRRSQIYERIKERNRPDLHVLFLESQCFDEVLLQSNMRLKLSSPDYKGQDPTLALQDFQRRVRMYEKKYISLGDYEERLGFSYFKMIDVGRKFITHNINGFLATQVVGYLQHFNLANRQVWLTRHEESVGNESDRTNGRFGLSTHGAKFAATLARFIDEERNRWNERQLGPLDESDDADGSLHMSTDSAAKLFRVWTSKMPRSIQTAQFFEKSRYDAENLVMLDELNSDMLGGSTGSDTETNERLEPRYKISRCEYVDVTKRLQSVILELERVTDHVLIIGGLAVTRALLAYCRDMRRDELASLDVPVGTLYMLEPKPYGVDYKEFVYNSEADWFDQKCFLRS